MRCFNKNVSVLARAPHSALSALFAGLLLTSALFFSSCNGASSKNSLPPACVTGSTYLSDVKMTSYNFEYPSVDPFGKPATLSGAIMVSDSVTSSEDARGILLYNHYTVFKKDECPSLGDLRVQKLFADTGLIIVSADYYGFGVTGDKNQAYCIASANARASLDALISAKKLLKALGFGYKNYLFNLGYSQGAQTGLGIIKLVTESYPDIHFNCSFLGGGPYCISGTYDQFVEAKVTKMPASVAAVFLSFNEFYKLGVDYSLVFKDPLLSNYEEWFFSKKYGQGAIDDKMGTDKIEDFITSEALDLNTDISKKFMEAMEMENLCKGWTPKSDENIVIVHNEADGVVPSGNAKELVKFLENKNVTFADSIEKNGVYVNIDTMQDLASNTHVSGFYFFLQDAFAKLKTIPAFSDVEFPMTALLGMAGNF